MPGEQYRLIFLRDFARSHRFTSPRRGSSAPRFKDRDRAGHSARLTQRLEEAWGVAEGLQRRAAVHTERHGAYIEFEGAPGFDLAIKSLENVRSGIRLLNVRRVGEGEAERVLATVYVPHRQRGYFLRRLRAYAEEMTAKGRPKNLTLVNSIEDIRHATLLSFWHPDEREQIPRDARRWVEVWLSSDRDDVTAGFDDLLDSLEIPSADGLLRFPERAIRLIHGTRADLERLIETSDDIAEFRPAKEVATFYVEMENQEQAQVVEELLQRLRFNADADAVVCILDTGVNNGHPLIHPILDPADLHTVDPAWGAADDPARPHGTLMAGTAAYGDILALLDSGSTMDVNHRLESAKIIPPFPGQNPRELWGHRTLQGISLAEIQEPQRKRVVCLAVTSTETRDRGRPSSWSAALDAVTSGYEDDRRRLVVLSAGNVLDSVDWRNYPASNQTNEVHDPGQSWNALTVGAFTEKVHLTDPTMTGWTALALAGELSPFSTTSATWPARKWPIKPEVVLEGGNVARGPNNSVLDHDDLQLLSTYHDTLVAHFAPFNATSASAAQAAWMAAQIQALYPEAWPETVRALIVQSAEWTPAMRRQFGIPAAPSKRDISRLLRVVGYGVPDLGRALHCASNTLTLISEAELQPFDKRGARYVTRDMHLYELPWPRDVLVELGETRVRMRVTLSYFVEPGPGEVGWADRYRYASHALRFEVNGPGESEQEFQARINHQARENDERPDTEGPGERWVIGTARNVGSIHSDIWEGSAVELAESNKIAVYPAVGWWRERHHLDRWNKRTRYSLVVSIHTPEESADIYVPVAQQIGVAVPVEVPASRGRAGRAEP